MRVRTRRFAGEEQNWLRSRALLFSKTHGSFPSTSWSPATRWSAWTG